MPTPASSGEVGRSAVNRRVASSNLARGANLTFRVGLSYAAFAIDAGTSSVGPFRPRSKHKPAFSAHSFLSGIRFFILE